MYLHTLEDKSVAQGSLCYGCEKSADDEAVKVIFSVTTDFYFL